MAYPQTTFNNTTIDPSSLLGRRRRAVSANTLLYQLKVLKETGRYDAFKLAWHPSYSDSPDVPPVPNHLFWDSDIAKWIEGACYFLTETNIPEVEAAVDELVEMIRMAQQADGYLNIHYTVVEPGKRFTNLRDMHELYNAGHLIEAALAHHALYDNDGLLKPLRKYADLLCQLFGPGPAQIHGYPGHPEIELALLRLYERTGERRYYNLASYFLTERGNPTGCQGHHFYDVELDRRGADPANRPLPWPEDRSLWYQQAHLPIAQQPTIEGHSVRAMYLLTAVADMVRMAGPKPDNVAKELEVAMYRLWDNMVNANMYLTGGIGAIKQWEGFGVDYFLPQGTDDGGCYAETCASIGVMMLAERILQVGLVLYWFSIDCLADEGIQFDLDGRFADIMELCLYNAVLTSMSHDGRQFTYVNQLASSEADPSKREEWFTCACCPPNVLRLFGQLGGYAWTHHVAPDGVADVAVHLYIPSTLAVNVDGHEIKVKQESDWPWKGDIKITVEGRSDKVGLRMRIPAWASEYQVRPPCPEATIEKGYLSLPSAWVAQHQPFVLSIPVRPRSITQSTNATSHGLLTLARGPVIYCVEDFDNPWVKDHFKGVLVDPTVPLKEHQVSAEEVTGDEFVALELQDGAADMSTVDLPLTASPFCDALAARAIERNAKPLSSLTFVPYYFRANRGGRGHMRVGLRPWNR